MRKSSREGYKNTLKAAIVAAGSLIPSTHKSTPEVPLIPQTTYSEAELQDQRDVRNPFFDLQIQTENLQIAKNENEYSSELSTNELISLYNVSTDRIEQLKILYHLAPRDVSHTVREALLKDYVEKRFDDPSLVMITLEELEELLGVKKDNTPWLNEMFNNYVLNNPVQIAALQPDWPEDPPNDSKKEYLEKRLDMYIKFRSALDGIDGPKARVIREILDSTKSAEVKQDMMYFVDDITRGTIYRLEAERIARDDEQLFEYLLQHIKNGDQVNQTHMTRLRQLANMYLPRREKLERVLTGI